MPRIFPRSALGVALATAAAWSTTTLADVIVEETFQTDGLNTRYTASEVCNDGVGDFFTRTDGSDIGSFYQIQGGATGNFFWAAQDTNGAPCTLTSEFVSLSAVDVSSFTNLTVSLLVAEDDDGTNQDWDAGSAFVVEYSVDGGAFVPFICFAEDGSGPTNTEPGVDADCDGVRDGDALTDTFSSFSGSVPDGGSLVLRMRTENLDAGDEDVAFDNILIEGDPVSRDPVINEFSASTTGPDVEYIEIFGNADTDYSALTLVVLDGDTGSEGIIDRTYTVGTTDADGYWQTGTVTNELENGSLTILLVEGFTGMISDDLDTDDDGTLDVTPWTAILDDVAVVDAGDLAYSTSALDEAFDDAIINTTFKPGGASRIANGTDTDTTADWRRNDFDLAGIPGNPGSPIFGEALNTPGAENEAVPADVPPQVDNTVPAEAGELPADASIVINFDEDVNFADNASIALSCGTPIAFTTVPGDLTTGPVSTVTIDPTVDLPTAVSCTVTLTAANITDSGMFELDGNGDGTGGDDFTLMFDTIATLGSCDDPATLISAIQGTTGTPTMIGSTVVVEAIVVGDFQDDTMDSASDITNLSGFFLQEEDADADPLTSEGIFVAEGGAAVLDVSEGDRVRVFGTVADTFDLTQLTSPSIVFCDSGNTVTPATAMLPRTTADEYEQFEGMQVTFDQTLTVSDVFNFVRFGEMVVSDGRLFQPTNIVAPGATATTQQAINDLNQLIFDDARNGSNQEPFAQNFEASNPVRGGDTLTNPTGVMGYAFNNFRLRPIGGNFTLDGANERPTTAVDPGGELKVASFNVENFFTTLNQRGANSASELTRQTNKIVDAIAALDADIVGLVELENDATTTITALVDAVNAVVGANTYDFVNSGVIGGDVIKVGMIYKPASVSLVGAFEIFDSNDDPTFDDSLNRPVLVQTFEDGSGNEFTVAVNHLKSKGCGGATGNNADQGDGQACFNEARTNAATALAAWLNSEGADMMSSVSPNSLIIGDLNAYAMEDPINAIKAEGFNDLIADFTNDEYSFSFFRQVGYLDHAMASASLQSNVTGVTIQHINADEADAIDYNEETLPGGLTKPANFLSDDQYRSADHDPLVLGLSFVVREEVLFTDSFETPVPQ